MITSCPTKKMLKHNIQLLNNPQSQFDMLLEDPNLKSTWRNHGFEFSPTILQEGEIIVVTNHPKRSWFATITRKNGKLVVS